MPRLPISACSTAVNAAEALQNESIHIASGFQLAGFSHVLATLWAAQDTAAQSVAVEFYRLLFATEGPEAGHAEVSYSFHRAVMSMRERKRNQPIL
jgi:CHAT domain-containing protein